MERRDLHPFITIFSRPHIRVPLYFQKMGNCADKVLQRIVELACLDDAGVTARRLGLVSKRFRSAAEPIELRYIAVSGLTQLRGVFTRLNMWKLPRGDELQVDVRHLFISELEETHAYAREESGGKFWLSDDGKKLLQSYLDDSHEFWILVDSLVKATSSKLRTLTMFTFDGWTEELYLDVDLLTSKLLGALSSSSFPNLTSLTIVHNAQYDQGPYENATFDTEFQHPFLPSLRRLRVISPFCIGVSFKEMRTIFHPLLAEFRNHIPELTELTMSILALECDEAAELLLGDGWDERTLSKKALPGKLRTVTFLPYPIDRRIPGALALSFQLLNIRGLKIRPTYPKAGQSWYHALF